MKSAILISGELRTFWFCADSIYNNIIKNNNADVFMYLIPLKTGRRDHPNNTTKNNYFNSAGSYTSRHDEYYIDIDELNFIKEKFKDSVKDIVISNDYTIVDKMTEKKINIFREKEQNTSFISNYTSPQRYVIEHHRNMYECLQLIKKYERQNKFTYDFIFRIRPDNYFKNCINFSKINMNYDLYVQKEPKIQNKFYTPDYIFFGKRKYVEELIQMFNDSYGEKLYTYDKYMELTNDTKSLNTNYVPELCFGYYVYLMKCKKYYFEQNIDWAIGEFIPKLDNTIANKYNIKKVDTLFVVSKYIN